jgi:hypothetical protein
MNRFLLCALCCASLGAHATCQPDTAELGDIGPGSELVCNWLEQRFPGAALVIADRRIHTGTSVTVVASVDGSPIDIGYRLVGFHWVPDDPGLPIAGSPDQ